MEFIFSFTAFILWKFRTIPYFFLCRVSISRIINGKKTRNLRGNHCECKTLFCSIEPVYLVTDCCTFQFSAHFSTVIWTCLYVWSVHNMTFWCQFDCTYALIWFFFSRESFLIARSYLCIREMVFIFVYDKWFLSSRYFLREDMSPRSLNPRKYATRKH